MTEGASDQAPAEGTDSPRARRATWRGRLAVLAVSTVVTLLLLELGVRLYTGATLKVRGVEWSADYGWRMLPNIEKRSAHWGKREPARTNSHGWRDAEAAYEKPAGVRRVVVLGDSFTFGQSVDYGERFTEYMEERAPGLEVINLGSNAYGTDQELRVLEMEGVRYAPDVVLLVAFLGNDLSDIRFDRKNYWPKPHYVLKDGRLELVPMAPTWDVRLRMSSYVGEGFFRLIRRWFPEKHFADALRGVDPVDLFVALVRRMAEVSEEHGAEFVVATVFSQGGEVPVPRELRAREALEDAGLQIVDTWETVRDATAAGEDLYAPDRHWNARGHEVIAELLIGSVTSSRR